jgi:hypothetical protein
MPLRFYRRFKITPALCVNLSRSCVSASVGRGGAWFTIGPLGAIVVADLVLALLH